MKLKCKNFNINYLTIISTTIVVFCVLYIVGCNPLNFDTLPEFNCGTEADVEGVSCNGTSFNANIYEVDNTGEAQQPQKTHTVIRAPLGRINILFVIDDSKSMKEQIRNISGQFTDFLQDIRRTDYQIAITTTDWEKQAGRFLKFPNGKTILSNPNREVSVHKDNVSHFRETMDISPGDQSDERGIYVLNQVLDNSANAAFFRPHSLFMVIIISDEDERSYGGKLPKNSLGEVFALDNYDLPETFFRKVSHQNKYSLVSVHSIIVKPNDESCEEEVNGIPGRIYAKLSRPDRHIMRKHGNILQGKISSICDYDYSERLGYISESIKEVPPFPLPCVPQPGVKMEVDGEEVRINVKDRLIYIEEDVNFGGQAKISFTCQK